MVTKVVSSLGSMSKVKAKIPAKKIFEFNQLNVKLKDKLIFLNIIPALVEGVDGPRACENKVQRRGSS